MSTCNGWHLFSSFFIQDILFTGSGFVSPKGRIYKKEEGCEKILKKKKKIQLKISAEQNNKSELLSNPSSKEACNIYLTARCMIW